MVTHSFYKTSSLDNVAKYSWELMSVIEFSLIIVEGGHFSDSMHTDLMILMCSRRRKISLMQLSTAHTFTNELFPSFGSEL